MQNNTTCRSYYARNSLVLAFLFTCCLTSLLACETTSTQTNRFLLSIRPEEKLFRFQAPGHIDLQAENNPALVYRFAISVPQAGLYAFETQGKLDTLCALVYTTANEERFLSVNDIGGSAENCKLIWALPSGTHTFKVRIDGNGPFRAQMRRLAWEKEVGATLRSGGTTAGHIEGVLDRHRFRFHLRAPRMIQLQALGEGNLQCVLQKIGAPWRYDPTFRQPYGSCVLGTQLEQGEYVFDLRTDQPNTSYKLTFQKIRMSPLQTGQIQEGFLREETFDLYQVDLQKDRYHRIQSHGTLAIRCTLEDELGHVIAASHNPDAPCSIEGSFPPKRYLLRVRTDKPNQQGRYQISSEQLPFASLSTNTQREITPPFHEALQIYQIHITTPQLYSFSIDKRSSYCALSAQNGKKPPIIDLSGTDQCAFFAELEVGHYFLKVYPLEREERPYKINIAPYLPTQGDQLQDRNPRLVGPVETGHHSVFLILVHKPQTVVLETHGSLDTVCELFRAELPLDKQTPIDRNDDGGTARNLNCQISRFLMPGQYKLRVRVQGRKSGRFWVQRRTLTIPQLRVGQPISAVFKSKRKPHRYLLPLSQPVVLALRTESAVDTVCHLLNNDGEHVAKDDDSGAGQNCMLTQVLPAGFYSLQVSVHRDVGPYRLFADTLPTPALQPNVILDGAFQPPYRTNYYALQLPKGGQFTMRTYGNQDTLCSLFNQQGKLLAKNDDRPHNDKNCQITEVLAAGIYYLQIRLHNNVKPEGNMPFRVGFTSP